MYPQSGNVSSGNDAESCRFCTTPTLTKSITSPAPAAPLRKFPPVAATPPAPRSAAPEARRAVQCPVPRLVAWRRGRPEEAGSKPGKVNSWIHGLFKCGSSNS